MVNAKDKLYKFPQHKRVSVCGKEGMRLQKEGSVGGGGREGACKTTSVSYSTIVPSCLTELVRMHTFIAITFCYKNVSR